MIGQKKVLDIEVCVDQNTVSNLIKRKEKLDEILVLRLDKLDKSLKLHSDKSDESGRKDIFVSLTGDYIPSSFGCSIECLIRLKKSISEYSSIELVELMSKYEHLDDRPKANNRDELLITRPLIEFDDVPSQAVEAKEQTSDLTDDKWELPKGKDLF